MFLPFSSLTEMVSPSSSIETISPFSVRKIFSGGVAAVPSSFAGSWPLAHQQPLQIGRETSPDSNSIQTPASAGGTANEPRPSPAYGAEGSAQPDSTSPSTSGTRARRRPRSLGSAVVGDHAAVLAVVGRHAAWSSEKLSWPVSPTPLRRRVKRCV